jgi:DNA-binding Xre family transcriptional regulator
MLSLHLTPILQARGIDKPHSFLVKSGISSYSAHVILNNKSRVFHLRHIELLCQALVCEPNDLLLYTENNVGQLPTNHPLHLLKKSAAPIEMRVTLASLPYKQLKEITNNINGLLQT